MRNMTYAAATTGVAVLLGSMVAAGPAHAKGSNFTEEAGACTAGSTWVMKAKPVARGIEMEFSVDSLRARQTWSVRVRDNGVLVFSGDRVTNRISQSFSVDRMLADTAGTDRLVARARNATTGEMCRGHVALTPAGGGGQG